MKTFSKILFTLLLLTVNNIYAQSDFNIHPSYQLPNIDSILKNQNISRLESDPEILIPIQFHLVKDKHGNLPDLAGIEEDLRQSNFYFKGANIQFYTCGKPNIIDNSDYYSLDGTALNDMVTYYNLPGTVDVFYVGDINQCSWCGIAYLGFSMGDVLLVKNQCIGNKTLAHELGHYFGLDHPHDNQGGVEYVDGTNCSTAGDQICDTPAEPNMLGKVDYKCNYIGNDKDPHGDAYKPSVNNIMSYIPSQCKTQFTTQQFAVMKAVYQTKHKNVLNCNPAIDFKVVIDQKTSRLEIGKDNFVKIYITNFSPTSVNSSVSYKIYLIDAVGRRTDLLTSSTTRTNWGQFSTDTVTAAVFVPSSATEGVFTLTAEINYDKVISEVNFLNNKSEKRLPVYNASTLLPDLELTLTSDSIHENGYQKSLKFKVKNIGNVDIPSNYGLIIHVSKDKIMSGDDMIPTQSYGSILKVGQVDSFSIRVNVPQDSLLPFYVIVKVDMEEMIEESNEDNNWAINYFTPILPAPNKWKYELTVSSVKNYWTDSAITSIDNNSGFSIKPTILNNSEINWWDYKLYPESELRFLYGGAYLSKDSIWDSNDIQIGKNDLWMYNNSSFLSISCNVKCDWPSGQYYLLTVADPDNYLTERNENNNVLPTKIQFNQSLNPDLRIVNKPTLSMTTLDISQDLTITTDVENIGNGSSYNWDVAHYLSPDPYVNYNDKFLGVSYFETTPFEPNTTKTKVTNLTISSTAAREGEYYFISCVRNHAGVEYSPNNCYIHQNRVTYGFDVSKIMGIPSESFSQSVNIYPVPANNELYIYIEDNSETNEIQISDLSGKVVLTTTILKGEKVDVQSLKNGFYILSITTSKGVNTEKFVINK